LASRADEVLDGAEVERLLVAAAPIRPVGTSDYLSDGDPPEGVTTGDLLHCRPLSTSLTARSRVTPLAGPGNSERGTSHCREQEPTNSESPKTDGKDTDDCQRLHGNTELTRLRRYQWRRLWLVAQADEGDDDGDQHQARSEDNECHVHTDHDA
jgi:hypothetical protein